MNPTHHPPIDDDRDRRLARLLSLDPAHPERVEFERDPRNRALLQAYLSFEAAEDDGSLDTRVDEAERTLAAAFDRDAAAAPPGRPRHRASSPAPRRSVGRRFALVASVLFAVGALWWMRPEDLAHEGPAGVLRGESHAAGDGLRSEWLTDGALELQWTASPLASSYVVRIQDSALGVLRVSTLAETTLVLDRAAVDSLLTQGATLWSVNPVVQDDELEVRGPEVLPARP